MGALSKNPIFVSRVKLFFQNPSRYLYYSCWRYRDYNLLVSPGHAADRTYVHISFQANSPSHFAHNNIIRYYNTYIIEFPLYFSCIMQTTATCNVCNKYKKQAIDRFVTTYIL